MNTAHGRWRWVAPPGWPAADPTWFPDARWRPPDHWPLPPQLHIFWKLDGVPDLHLDDTGERVNINWAPDLRGIPLAWVPAPGWPEVPPGWFPPAGWKRPREWPKPPRNFEHWRPDPRVKAAREHQWWRDTVEQMSALLSSTNLRRIELLNVELRWTSIWAATRVAHQPLRTEISAKCAPAFDAAHLADTRAREVDALAAIHAFRCELLYSGSTSTDALRVAAAGVSAHRAEAAHLAAVNQTLDIRAHRFARQLSLALRRHVDLRDVRAAQAVERQGIAEAESFARDLSYALALTRPIRVTLTRPYSWRDDEDAPWRQAELAAAAHLRSLGFADATAGDGGTDAGFDVLGRGIVAQVKYLANPVGRPEVQKLAGANQHGASMAFYSRAGYANTALTFADHANVALFILELPDQVQAANETARLLSRRH